MNTVKILILDDSIFIRELLHHELERDINIEVVAKACDPYEARDKIIEYRPDIMISDVHMDKMNGVDFVNKLLPQYYLPVIMISSDPSIKPMAEKTGAITFIEKPDASGKIKMDTFLRNLLLHIKAIANNERTDFDLELLNSKIIAIGASTGGAEAVETLLKGLPAVMPPIVIAQHMPAKFTNSFATRLNNESRLSIKEAESGDVLLPGQVYIAPGGLHTSLKKKDNRYILSCDENTSGLSTCPSIDILFNSVAASTKGSSIGVLLTGMGSDGAAGLKVMHDTGSRTIGQDKTAVIYGMPRVAFELGAVDVQLPLERIARKLVEFTFD